MLKITKAPWLPIRISSHRTDIIGSEKNALGGQHRICTVASSDDGGNIALIVEAPTSTQPARPSLTLSMLAQRQTR